MWALPKRAAEGRENTENSCFQTRFDSLKVVGMAGIGLGAFNTFIRLNDAGETESSESFISEKSGDEFGKSRKIVYFGLFSHLFFVLCT